MANTDITSRTQVDRPDLSVPSTGIHLRSKRGLAIYTALALPILGVLIFATIQGIESWVQALVLAVIVLTTVGLMIAVSPSRRS
jgi:hypothetical protein